MSVELRDYRDIAGTYDAIVSIEMLEAVGAEYYATFFEACDRALRPGGRLSLQVITFPDVAYGPQLRGRQLDPDVHLPGWGPAVARGDRVHRCTGPACSSVGSTTSPRATCRRSGPGARRSSARLDEVRAMGFDERFIRMWDYYLAISEAGFATGITQDLQIVLEKGRGLG